MRISTKTNTEKMDEWSESRVKGSPKQKPPRYDKRRKHYVEDDPDLKRKEDKDVSMKYAIDMICCLALTRGDIPSYSDIDILSNRVSKYASSPKQWPQIVSIVKEYFDKKARYTRVMKSPDGKTFMHGDPLPMRSISVESSEEPFYPSSLSESDIELLMKNAKSLLDPWYVDRNKDAAYRKALDEAIWTLDDGKYQGKIDAPTYIVILNDLLGVEDLKNSIDQFDLMDYFGKPADSDIDSDTTDGEKWKKYFENAKPIQYDKEDKYIENFRDPTV